MLAEPALAAGAPGAAAAHPLDGYDAAPGAIRDLYLTAPPAVAEAWRATAAGLAALGPAGLASAQEQVARQGAELGLAFRIAGEHDERPWPLTAMPLILGGEEWALIERGLAQRARLIEAVLADVYGEQRLVARGVLPPAVIAGSRYFARKMLGTRPHSGHFLHVYAADLARDPSGRWRILGDRVRLANGIGYALENRMAASRAFDDVLSRMHARRLADFFAAMRDGIAADCGRDRPRIALVTPGRFNQSYPEQAHLARYLGIPLVEGRDLVVTGDRLFVRTIAGPKRIDAAWRWIDTNALDPLNFDSRSSIGVPNLFEAWTRGGLEVVNWPGAEVLEATAFGAFLPRLAAELLNEDPLLPNAVTWWCGEPGDAETVRARLDRLVIAPAFDQPVAELPDGQPIAGASLEPARRDALLAAMHLRPIDYCAQEPVALSTTPALVDGRLVPRPFTLRAFVARTAADSWTVMPGGFARVSSSGEPLSAVMRAGEVSADVCIVDAAPASPLRATMLGEEPRVTRGGGILASQAADNLYWFGRYAERAEATTRVVRAILGGSIEVDGGHARDAEVRGALVAQLRAWDAIAPATTRQPFLAVCGAALTEAERAGGVAALVRRVQQIGLLLRDRFAVDFWDAVRRPMPAIDTDSARAMLASASALIGHFGGMSGLVAENMVRGLAWRFLDIGRRLERALALCRVARRLTALSHRGDALGMLLDIADSQIAYRARYLTGPARSPVLDLVLLDPENPRALIFQAQRLAEHIAALPALNDDCVPEAPLLAARAALGPLEAATAPGFSDDALGEVEKRLLALSDAISTRYFLQFERPEDPPRQAFLV